MKVMAMIRDHGCAALIVSHEVELIRKVRERRIQFTGGNSSGHVQPRGFPNHFRT
jgi:ABC-type polar amino acid transport system ATPase subunit